VKVAGISPAGGRERWLVLAHRRFARRVVSFHECSRQLGFRVDLRAAPVSCLGRAEEPHLPGVLSRRRLHDPRIAHFLLLLAPRRSTLRNLACAGISRSPR
jgi:hypothetical protein